MTVDRNSWHARIYLWWYSNKYDYRDAAKASSNLCPYMRAVMFWAPLRFLFWGWAILFHVGDKAIRLCYFTWPLFLYSLPVTLGYASYRAKIILLIIYGDTVLGALSLGVIIGSVYLCQLFKVGDRLDAKLQPAVRRRQLSSFFSLIQSYLRTFHDGVCPEVELRDESEAA